MTVFSLYATWKAPLLYTAVAKTFQQEIIMKLLEAKQKERERVRALVVAAWDKKVASFDSFGHAANNGFTYTALAESLGVTKGYISNQFTGQINMSAKLLDLLGTLLEISPEDLVYNFPKPTSKPKVSEETKAKNKARQQEIKQKIESGEYARISPILLTTHAEVEAWGILCDQAKKADKTPNEMLKSLIINNAVPF